MHDIITVLSRRLPNLWIEIVPVSVQGPRAEAEICAALNLVNKRGDADIVILARGGGSLEDLQAFNSEAVAMAIFNSAIPVVSAVGHETDVTISDFIADLRAPTPSAAAELVVPDKNNLARRLRELDHGLRAGIARQTKKLDQSLKQLYKRIQDPRKKLQEAWLRLDDFSIRLERSLLLRSRHASDLLLRLRRHLDYLTPQVRIKEFNKQLDIIIYNLLKNINILISNKRSSFREQTIKLEAMNPLAILKRGYSVTRSLPGRQVILHPGQVSVNQGVEILLAKGFLLCDVKGKSTYGEEDI